jgi:sensor histidine kinase regulating citrate/malate metabolism
MIDKTKLKEVIERLKKSIEKRKEQKNEVVKYDKDLRKRSHR